MKLSGVVGTLTTVSCAGIISDVFPAVLSRRRPSRLWNSIVMFI